jgi:hypothetical protein
MSVLRCEPQVVRKMPAVWLVIAAGLSAWVFELGAVRSVHLSAIAGATAAMFTVAAWPAKRGAER